jgi:hypothetical protein
MTSPLGVIKQKEMKNNKGREGGPKIGKIGRHRLWMAPYRTHVCHRTHACYRKHSWYRTHACFRAKNKHNWWENVKIAQDITLTPR